MRRARETAACIVAVTGLPVQADARLREWLNWDASMPWEAFADLWARTADDRDLVCCPLASHRAPSLPWTTRTRS